MDEILALQRQLAAVQEQSNTIKLSDRNIVEIVDTLIKNYQTRLIFTVDGREYLTPDHLINEIADVVRQYGRINIVEIPKILNVSLEKIENRIPDVSKTFSDISFLDGQLFTSKYFDNICEEINEDLLLRHSIPISEIALKYSLPNEYLVNSLTLRLGSIIQGDISKNTLITHSYQNTVKAQIKGILRASLKPIGISLIKKLYGHDEQMVNQIIDDLLKNNEIDGQVKQGTYISTRFIQNQQAIIRKFFEQNNYVEYNFLKKNLFITNPRDYLKELFAKQSIFLDSCCFNKAAIGNIKEQISEVLDTEGYIDVTNLLPSILSESEIENIITKYMELDDFELHGSLVVSTHFLQKCVLKFKDKIVDIIYNAPQRLIEADDDGGKKKGKKKGKGGGSSINKDLFSKEEITQHLKNLKVIPDEYDSDFEDIIAELIKQRLVKYYEQVKIELFESKKTPAADVISDLQAKLDEKLNHACFMAKSIQVVEEKNNNIDVLLLKGRLNEFLRRVLENMITLYCKKYTVKIPSEFLNQDSMEERKDSDAIKVNLDEPLIFKSRETLLKSIELLPKDLSKKLKELEENINAKKPLAVVEILQKEALELGIKQVSTEKKAEKNFFMAQKYFVKEDLKGVKGDPQFKFFLVLNNMAMERNLYFGVKFGEKETVLLASVLKDDSGVKEEAKGLIQKIFDVYQDGGKRDEFEKLVVELKGFLAK